MKLVATTLALAACLAIAPAVQATPQTYNFTGEITFSATDPSWVGQQISGSIVVDLGIANFVSPVQPTFSTAKYDYLQPFGTPPAASIGVVTPSFTLPGGSNGLNIDPPYYSLTSAVTAYYHNSGIDRFEYRAAQDACAPGNGNPCYTNVPRNSFGLYFEDDTASGKMITSSSLQQVPDLAFATSATGQAYYVISDGTRPGQFNFAYYVGFDITSFTAAQPVPEPATWALMGLGLAGVAGLARRRARG